MPIDINDVAKFLKINPKESSDLCRFVLDLEKNNALPDWFIKLPDDDKCALLLMKWDSNSAVIEQISDSYSRADNFFLIISVIESPVKRLELLFAPTSRKYYFSLLIQSTTIALIANVFNNFSRVELDEFVNNIHLRNTTAYRATKWIASNKANLFFSLFEKLSQEQIIKINSLIIRKVAKKNPALLLPLIKEVDNKLLRLKLLFGLPYDDLVADKRIYYKTAFDILSDGIRRYYSQKEIDNEIRPIFVELIQELLEIISIEDKKCFVEHDGIRALKALTKIFPELLPYLFKDLPENQIILFLNITDDKNKPIIFPLAKHSPKTLIAVLKKIDNAPSCLQLLFGSEIFHGLECKTPYDVFYETATNEDKENLDDFVRKALSETDKTMREDIFTTPDIQGMTGVMRLAKRSPLLLIPLFKEMPKKQIATFLTESNGVNQSAIERIKKNHEIEFWELMLHFGSKEMALKQLSYLKFLSFTEDESFSIDIQNEDELESVLLQEVVKKHYEKRHPKFFELLKKVINIYSSEEEDKSPLIVLSLFKEILNNNFSWLETCMCFVLLLYQNANKFVPILESIDDSFLQLQLLFYPIYGEFSAYHTLYVIVEDQKRLDALIDEALNKTSPKDKFRLFNWRINDLHRMIKDRKSSSTLLQALFKGMSEDQVNHLWNQKNSKGKTNMMTIAKSSPKDLPNVLKGFHNNFQLFQFLFDIRNDDGMNSYNCFNLFNNDNESDRKLNEIIIDLFLQMNPNVKYERLNQFKWEDEKLIGYFIDRDPMLLTSLFTNMSQEQVFYLLTENYSDNEQIFDNFSRNYLNDNESPDRLKSIFTVNLTEPLLQVKLLSRILEFFAHNGLRQKQLEKVQSDFENKLLALSPNDRFAFLGQFSLKMLSPGRLPEFFNGMSKTQVFKLLNEKLDEIQDIVMATPELLENILAIADDKSLQLKILLVFLKFHGEEKYYEEENNIEKEKLLKITIDTLLSIDDAPISIYPTLVFVGGIDNLQKDMTEYLIKNIEDYHHCYDELQNMTKAFGIVLNFDKSSDFVKPNTTEAAIKLTTTIEDYRKKESDYENSQEYLNPKMEEKHQNGHPFWGSSKDVKDTNNAEVEEDFEYQEMSELN